MSEQSRVITGFRPTSDLTMGNYLGAIKPSIDLQNDPNNDLYVFVADLHGLTDNDPRAIAPFRLSVVRDCIALGIDPQKSTLYLQSDIESPVVQIANRLGPYISVGKLASTPNLKDKIHEEFSKGRVEDEEALRANYALLGYPVLMAADIFAQSAEVVPVGTDQRAHLEITRDIARKFNNFFEANVLVEPREKSTGSVKVLSLDGKGKMSKSNPSQAIAFNDDPDEVIKKIKRATTAGSGEWNDAIESHFMVAESSTDDEVKLRQLSELKAAHLDEKNVMKDFKELWSAITVELLVAFQARRDSIKNDVVKGALRYHADKAERNANTTLNAMRDVMGF